VRNVLSHALTALVFTAVGIAVGSVWFGHRAGRTPADPVAARSRIRVEVLNAAGVEGLARRATDSLRAAGFDVVYYGNAPTFDRETSVVLDRTGSLENAVTVGATLGIANVRSEPNPNLYVDVTVLLGRDWTPPPTRAPAPAASRASSGGPWGGWRALRDRIREALRP
jgi:hypothetical protein